MTPLHVVSHIPGQISLPHKPLALDALLASQIAIRAGSPPPANAGECQPIEIPVAKEPGGRFHLCSVSRGKLTEFELHYINRRAPVEQYQLLGPPSGRVQITGGPDKSYRIPLEVGHLENSRLEWWCLGLAQEITDLLSTVTHLGKKRGTGLGAVDRWDVLPVDPWPGFPVVRDGQPLRPLPADWPGLVDPPLAYGCLTMPYWDHSAEDLIACPS